MIRFRSNSHPKLPAIDFKYTLDHCRENSLSKAYHLIQAFAPGEVSFNETHQIGDAYFRKHESQIILYGGARRMLESP